MTWKLNPEAPSSLALWTQEELFDDDEVKTEIAACFAQGRAFPFFVIRPAVEAARRGAGTEELRALLAQERDRVVDEVASTDRTIRQRLLASVRLPGRILDALVSLHRALARATQEGLLTRRYVLVRERPGAPTLFHLSANATVLAHVGLGPAEHETPSIYIGLQVFDVLASAEEPQEGDCCRAFLELLAIEERAIETGYAHTTEIPPEIGALLSQLLVRLERLAGVIEAAAVEPSAKMRPFAPQDRRRLLAQLNARAPDDRMRFDHAEALRAVETLERMARRFKAGGDRASLREVARLLVAAAAHDVHDVRNRANLILERLLAPKEFDAPLATSFETVRVGSLFRFEFALARARADLYVRVYRESGSGDLPVDAELDYWDLPLEWADGRYTATWRFRALGRYDWVLYKKLARETVSMQSGRINVIPDVRGHLVMEIFPDVHGHTRLYWADPVHPGLVYNEAGQVIRLGNFADVAAHLADMKERYGITAVYLLGVQKRGSNREDWAPEARSPSPFAPESLVEIEPSLGGPEGLKALVAEAHRLEIKVIVDIVPHLNRRSTEVPDDWVVRCHDERGNVVVRASTDGRYGSWNDGKLLNWRRFEVWEWFASSVARLIEEFDIDGLRFDSAHAVPIVMKRDNYPLAGGRMRTVESMVEGEIIVNDREHDHFVTTGYYDSACRELIAPPFHSYLGAAVRRAGRARRKRWFVTIAECYWGREQFLSRTGLIAYNSALFKICENIVSGSSDVREIYHLYDDYYPRVLPRGAELIGILGNHDERRAVNAFGPAGLRAPVMLTLFMSNIVMDYEGSAEGENWRIFVDNIYVNWHDFEAAAYRGLEDFYKQAYAFHRHNRGRGHLVWAGNNMVAAAIRFSRGGASLCAFSFADQDQHAMVQFDNPALPLDDAAAYRLIDPVYSPVTGRSSWYTARELRVSRIGLTVPRTDRIKMLRLERVRIEEHYADFLRDSFDRMCSMDGEAAFASSFAFEQITAASGSLEDFAAFLQARLLPLYGEDSRATVELGLKRALFHVTRAGLRSGAAVLDLMAGMAAQSDPRVAELGASLLRHNERGPLVFLAAEVEPFSKSGGLANVVAELPRELVRLGEQACIVTPLYRHGDAKAVQRMRLAVERHGIAYTGTNVRFWINGVEYEAGVHSGWVEGVRFFMLDHHEFFDGLYWGITAEEKLRRRVALARAAAEVIRLFELRPNFVFTNDAYTGPFAAIVRSDPFYASRPEFQRITLIHVIHNGGWQYFDAFHRFENGRDLFSVFGLAGHEAWRFADPADGARLSCMASGVRSADRVVTVSPSYARQIQVACDGLERILHGVIGINNGVDSSFKAKAERRLDESGFVETNYPRLLERLQADADLGKLLETRYPEILAGPRAPEQVRARLRRSLLVRMRNKLLLQVERNLRVDPDAVLCCMIHRITEQKGFQLFLEASEGLFRRLGVQAIVGGAPAHGDTRGQEIARGLEQLAGYYPGQVWVGIGFQDVSVPLLACDVFLMPSLHEPGGISQLEALACGCFVVARATGGLRDTISSLRVVGGRILGNGILFSDYAAWALHDAMQRCRSFLRSVDELRLTRAREALMQSVYGWRLPAERYLREIYAIKEIVRPEVAAASR